MEPNWRLSERDPDRPGKTAVSREVTRHWRGSQMPSHQATTAQITISEFMGIVVAVAVSCIWPRLWLPVITILLVVVLHRRRVSFSLVQTCAICGVAALLGLILGLCLSRF